VQSGRAPQGYQDMPATRVNFAGNRAVEPDRATQYTLKAMRSEKRKTSLTCVELRGLEPLTPCLQIAVIVRVTGSELDDRPPVSDRGVPLLTGVNGTLMAR
jgi:hypothetical protein